MFFALLPPQRLAAEAGRREAEAAGAAASVSVLYSQTDADMLAVSSFETQSEDIFF